MGCFASPERGDYKAQRGPFEQLGAYKMSEGSSEPTQMTVRRFSFSRKEKLSSDGWAER